MPAMHQVVNKLTQINQIKLMRFEPRSSKAFEDTENPIDMLLKVKDVGGRALIAYFYDQYNGHARSDCVNAVLDLMSDDFVKRHFGDVESDKVFDELLGFVDAVVLSVVNATVNETSVKQKYREAFRDVTSRVAQKMSEAYTDMMKDDYADIH
jgi:hypothetical protein